MDNNIEEKSIDTAIKKWLSQNKKISEIAQTIHSEELPDNINELALQRTGVEKLSLKYVTDTGWYRQYQYALLLKNNSEDDKQRLTNLDWLDELSDWIDAQNKNKNYPVLKEKRVKEISCANAITYETNEDGSISTYYLQLYFNIRGGI